MKNVFKIFTILTLTTLLFVSCEPDDEAENVYTDVSLVHFDYSGRDRTFSAVFAEEPTRSLIVPFNLALTKPAGADVNGTLVFLPEESTAILGTDFVIDKANATIPTGSVVGDFQITIFSNNTGFVDDIAPDPIVKLQNVRTAVFMFTNESSVANASFYQRFVVNITTVEEDTAADD